LQVPVNILFVIPSLGRRGTERQLVELLRGLVNDSYRLHVVTLVDIAPSYTKEVEALGVTVTCLNCQGRLDYLKSVFPVRKLIKTLNIDIVHGFLNLGSWVGAIAGRSCGVRVIAASIRDARDSNGSLKFYRALTVRLADVYTSNSKAGFDNRYSQWGKHFQVIYNGIDTARFANRHLKEQSYRDEFAIQPEQRCVAMVAALSEHKDYQTYINAAAIILGKRSDVVFLGVGDGPDKEKIFAYAEQHGSPVKFLGSRNDVDNLWSVADISVMLTNTALIEEGLPNSVMESLACGVPTIANNAGGTVEVIDHELNGYLLDSADPELVAKIIERWLDDPDLYASLSKAAEEKVQRCFSYEHYLETHRELYRKLTSN